VCEGSVFDGKIVLASQVTAPSFASAFSTGISDSATTAGFAPSMLMMNTCFARTSAKPEETKPKQANEHKQKDFMPSA
jgi:hypothetical protein